MLLPAHHNLCPVLVLMKILTRIDQCKKLVYLVGVRARRVLTAPTFSYQSGYYLCTELNCWVFVAWSTRLFQFFFVPKITLHYSGRAKGETCKGLWCAWPSIYFRFRIPHSVWRWQVHRIWPHLWQCWCCQEIWAQISPHPGTSSSTSYCLWDYWLGGGSLSHSSSPYQVKARVSGCHLFFPISSCHKNPCWQGHSHSIVHFVIFLKYTSFDVVCVGCSQNGLATKVEKSRKQMKERRNRAKKIRGVKKVTFSLLVATYWFLCVYLWLVLLQSRLMHCGETLKHPCPQDCWGINY